MEVLKSVVLVWLESNYPAGNYVFQQDSAPGHKAKVTQKWCQEHLANFWPWSMWPPSSSDCNPLDYGIWGAVERKACGRPESSGHEGVGRHVRGLREEHVQGLPAQN